MRKSFQHSSNRSSLSSASSWVKSGSIPASIGCSRRIVAAKEWIVEIGERSSSSKAASRFARASAEREAPSEALADLLPESHLHLPRGLFGEGDRDDPRAGRLPALDDREETAHEEARLAGARPRLHAERGVEIEGGALAGRGIDEGRAFVLHSSPCPPRISRYSRARPSFAALIAKRRDAPAGQARRTSQFLHSQLVGRREEDAALDAARDDVR